MPVFRYKSQERSERISQGSVLTLRELMTDASFESVQRKLMKRPQFLFGDSIPDDSDEIFDGKYKWIRVIGD